MRISYWSSDVCSSDLTAGMRFVAWPMKPGDMALFDAYVPHRSEPNPTNTARRVYFATYNRASEGDHLERYYADKRRNFPPDIARDAGREYVYRVYRRGKAAEWVHEPHPVPADRCVPRLRVRAGASASAPASPSSVDP